jgi:hypothetical protein
VPLAELGVGSPKQVPAVPLWATSSKGDIIDRAPNRETGDACPHPRARAETLVQSRIVIGKLIFVGKTPFLGYIDGTLPADGACTMDAHGAGKKGTFIAWFADKNSVDPAKRFGNIKGPFSTANGTMVALDTADLAICNKGAGSDCLRAPINRDIHSYTVPAGTLIWTGVLPSGSASGAPNCDGWTSDAASDNGNGGDPSSLGAGWSTGSIGACNVIRRLICLQLL